VLFISLGVITTALGIGILAVIGWVIGIAASAPSLDHLKPIQQGANSVVYASDGKTRLGFITSDVLRTPIGSSDIPQSIRNATVAIEDRRFYQHKGIDLEGIVRAALKDIESNHAIQGGSTLTMQLVRNLYQEGHSRTLKRKIREAKLAQELEDRHPGMTGKRWILDKYLNNVPYGTVGGQTAVGIQAASRVFFDKPAKELTLPEAALIAGLPQAPSLYNPFLDPQAAVQRRNDVLQHMADQHYISQDQAAAAIQSPLGVRHSRYYTERREGYFFDYVKQELIRKYGIEKVREGGLRIYTTINLRYQKLARKAIANHLNRPGDPSAALVSIDPRNGHILAMASSSKYGVSKFNLAAQAHRQAGSTFKIMVLMTALRRGVDPVHTTYVSKPLHFFDKETGTEIDVQTDDHKYLGRTNLVEGIVHSDNTVFQQLDLDMGPEAVRQTAYDMGITSHLDAYPAEGLGGLRKGVSPLEMANAYATIDSGGYRNRPIAITKVVDADGHVDTSLGTPHRVKVFTDGQTAEAIKIMEQNVQRGTGTAAQISCTVAGKTGTTSNFTDAWFDGMTPDMTTAVWVGYPNQTVSMTNVPPVGEVFGGTIPAFIWHDYMQVVAGSHCKSFPTPKVPFQSEPFFGKYATTGAPGGGLDSQGQYGYGAPAPGTGGTSVPKKKDHQGGGTGGGGTGGGGYPPTLYESPPQTTPTTQPPPAPVPGGTTTPPGNGNGNGPPGQG